MAVVGGSGGVGASCLAAALAVRATAAAKDCVLVDGIRLSGGLDVTLGMEQDRGLRWPELAGVSGAVDGLGLCARLPCRDGVRVLSFDRSRDVALPVDAAAEVLDGLAAASDLLVLDAPRPDVGLGEMLVRFADVVVLLAGTRIAELAAASAVAPLLVDGCDDVRLCVRSRGRGGEFADVVAEALDLPLTVVLRDEPGLDADLERGVPPGEHARGALASCADTLLLSLARGRRLAS